MSRAIRIAPREPTNYRPSVACPRVSASRDRRSVRIRGPTLRGGPVGLVPKIKARGRYTLVATGTG